MHSRLSMNGRPQIFIGFSPPFRSHKNGRGAGLFGLFATFHAQPSILSSTAVPRPDGAVATRLSAFAQRASAPAASGNIMIAGRIPTDCGRVRETVMSTLLQIELPRRRQG